MTNSDVTRIKRVKPNWVVPAQFHVHFQDAKDFSKLFDKVNSMFNTGVDVFEFTSRVEESEMYGHMRVMTYRAALQFNKNIVIQSTIEQAEGHGSGVYDEQRIKLLTSDTLDPFLDVTRDRFGHFSQHSVYHFVAQRVGDVSVPICMILAAYIDPKIKWIEP